MTQGVIYIATGQQYINEAVISAQSVKNINNKINIALYTDRIYEKIKNNIFDEIKLISSVSYDVGDSVLGPDMIQHDKTLFLDTDTYVCEGFEEGYDLLETYDMAAAHNPGCRISDYAKEHDGEFIPDSFPQFNTGVLFMSDSDIVKQFLSEWRSLYNKYKNITSVTGNQTAFREAVYESNIRLSTLPQEYNTRVRYKGTAGSLTQKSKIIHGRHPEGLQTVAKKINSVDGMRAYTMKKYPLELINRHPSIRYIIKTIINESDEKYSYKKRFINSIEENGMKETLSKVYNRYII